MKEEKNVFLTADITMEEDFDNENHDRYEFTKRVNPDDYGDFLFDSFEDWKEEQGKQREQYETEKEAKEQYEEDKRQAFEEWADDNLSYDELYEIPMMNALRYFPSFCSFTDNDRRKVCGATTLLYDSELDAWAVGMTGGGMDLSPHLLDTFIELGNGVPIELAEMIRLDWNAYVKKEKHIENCRLLANAYMEKAKAFISTAKELNENENSAISRHATGLLKAME